MTLTSRSLVVVLLAMAAWPAQAAWKALRRDSLVMLSVDPQSIHREGNVTTFRYLVDFRLNQGDTRVVYRSIVAQAKVDCKARLFALVHTDAYQHLGGQGIIVAKTKLTPQEMAFKPPEAGTSDEDLWNFVCEGKTPPKSALPPPPPPLPQKQ